MFKNSLMKRKLFFNWLISYLSVLLIAATIISIIYYRVERTIENETDRANELHLSKIQKTGDLRLNDMSSIARLVGIDRRVRTLANIKPAFGAEHQLDIISIKDFLNIIKVSNGFIDQIYVYFRNTDSSISSDSHVDSELSYKLFNSDKAISFEEWKQIVNKRYQGNFVNDLTLNIGDGKYDAVSFIQSIPVEEVSAYTANIVIQFNRDKFQEVLRSVVSTDQNIVMLVNNDEVIASTSTGNVIDTKKVAGLKEKSGFFFDSVNDKKVLVSYINSDIPGYRYISIIPYNIYLEKVINSRRLVLIISISFVILGALGVQYIVRRNYNPINTLIENITKKLGMPLESQRDELSFIQSVLTNTMDENDKIIKKMKENEDVIRTSFLERLLKGRVDESKITEEILRDFELSFESQHFAVMLFVIEDHDSAEDVGEEMYGVKLLHFIITNVVGELINQSHKGMMVELDNSTIACIVNIKNSDGDNGQTKREIVEAVRSAQQFVSEHFKIRFSASLSNIYDTFSGIAFAYREALNAMNHKAFMGEGSIICHDDVAKLDNFYEYSADTEYKLMNVIREGNFADAKRIVDGIFESNFNNLSLTVETGECLVFDLLGTLIKIVDDNVLMDKLQPISRLKKCSTIRQIKAEIISLLEYICEYFLQKNKVKSEYKLSMDVMGYIEKNYQNENLNVAMIGEHFNMTSNYLSRMFKTQVEEGLHNYIERIRIEKAKELMRNEKLNILEVAKEVGYTNSKTFIRVFKKIEGTTPGKYRELV